MVRVTMASLLAAMVAGAALAAGCSGVDGLTIGGGGGTTTGLGGSTSSGGGTTGVPCDVSSALAACIVCHSNPPIAGAVGSLTSYADLTGLAPADSIHPGPGNETMAQAALRRMQDPANPMPPGGGATSAQISALQGWIAAGTPMGDCTVDAGVDPTFTDMTPCNGGTYYGDEGRGMDPGQPCILCHQQRANAGQEAGPIYTFAGTVFALGHARDNCLPSATQQADLAQAQVVITGSNGASITIGLIDSKGNFDNGNFFTTQSVPLPYTAKVVYMGKERKMMTPQMVGDCNTCHTVAGANGAPGRIALPQ